VETNKTRVYVGNLDYAATQSDLIGLFGKFGTIKSVVIVLDRVTRLPRGFGFVDYNAEESAQKALAINGEAFLSRRLQVELATPLPETAKENRKK